MQATEPYTAVFARGDAAALSRLRHFVAAHDPPRAAAPASPERATSSNHFDAKTDSSSASMYFHYYGMLQHQQNMMQDSTRTGTYYWAMLGNRSDFEGKVVVDVGAGSGILSLFAAQVCHVTARAQPMSAAACPHVLVTTGCACLSQPPALAWHRHRVQLLGAVEWVAVSWQR